MNEKLDLALKAVGKEILEDPYVKDTIFRMAKYYDCAPRSLDNMLRKALGVEL